MIKCPTAGSHILHPITIVFQAFVILGTHPVYLNPTAHSAVKPWHEGSSTLILHPCLWQRVGSSVGDASNEIKPKSSRKVLTSVARRSTELTFSRIQFMPLIMTYLFIWVKHLSRIFYLQGIFFNI